MHPLWKVLNFTSEFKYEGEIWRIIHGDNDHLVARNLRTQHLLPFDKHCLVEPTDKAASSMKTEKECGTWAVLTVLLAITMLLLSSIIRTMG